MPRGGRRSGKPGGQYPQRTDMQMGPRALPVTTAPNQEYGAAGQQADAQRAVPMASGPLTQTPDVQAQAQQFNPPPVVGMGEPSLNPNEPVTTGMDAGIGQTVPTQAGAYSLSAKTAAALNSVSDAHDPEIAAFLDQENATLGNEGAP